MIVQDGSLKAFAAFSSFGYGGLPDYRSYTKNNWYYEASSDGLPKIGDPAGRYARAQALSNQVDQYRADPRAADLSATEIGLANTISQAMGTGAANYEWGGAFGRDRTRQFQLDAALAQLDDALNTYLDQIPRMLADYKARIAQEAKDASDAAAAAAQLKIQTSVAQAAKAELERSTASAASLKTQKEEISAQIDIQKLIKQASAPTLFGVPTSVVALGAVALIGGVFLFRKRG